MTGLPSGLDSLPSGRIRARFRCKGCTDHPKGGQHSQTFLPRPSQPNSKDGGVRAAQAWLRDQQRAVDRERFIAPSQHRAEFGEFATERAVAWRKHKESTRAAVQGHLRLHILPDFGSRALGSITTADVEAWVARKEVVLAPATLHVVFAWLQRIFSDAVRLRYIIANPCTGVELPPIEKREVKPVPLDGVQAIYEAMPEHLRTAVLVGLWAGLRQGEVLGLRRHRLSLIGRRDDNGALHPPSLYVAEQLQALKGAPRLVMPKTRQSVRRVPIPTVLVDSLAEHLAAYPTDAEGFVFRNRNGNPVRRNYFSEVWAKAVAEGGLPKGTRFHDLRHTYASMLIRAGESVTVVSKRLGHASPVETLETYSHMWPDSDEHTVTVLNAAHDVFATERVTAVSPVADLRR